MVELTPPTLYQEVAAVAKCLTATLLIVPSLMKSLVPNGRMERRKRRRWDGWEEEWGGKRRTRSPGLMTLISLIRHFNEAAV